MGFGNPLFTVYTHFHLCTSQMFMHTKQRSFYCMKSKLALSSRRDGLNAICCVDSVLQGSARIRMHFLSIEMFWVFLPFFFPLDSRVASDKSPTFHLSIFLTWVLLESNSSNTIVLKGELQLHQGKELIHTHNFFRDLSRCPISLADLHRVSGE